MEERKAREIAGKSGEIPEMGTILKGKSPGNSPGLATTAQTNFGVALKSTADPSTAHSPDPQRTRIEEEAGERSAQDDKP
jgi:hypothetical protein